MRAWTIVWALVDGAALERALVAGAPGADVEHACRHVLERTMERATKWMLANGDAGRAAADVVAEVAPALARVRARLPQWIAGAEAEAFHRLLAELQIAGLGPALAHDLATAEWLTGALDVVRLAHEAGVDPEAAAAAYYGLEQQLDFAWLWARLAESADEDPWQRRAAEGLVDDLLRARRRLAAATLRASEPALPARSLAAVHALVRELRARPRSSLAALAVVVREMRRLAEGVVPGEPG